MLGGMHISRDSVKDSGVRGSIRMGSVMQKIPQGGSLKVTQLLCLSIGTLFLTLH